MINILLLFQLLFGSAVDNFQRTTSLTKIDELLQIHCLAEGDINDDSAIHSTILSVDSWIGQIRVGMKRTSLLFYVDSYCHDTPTNTVRRHQALIIVQFLDANLHHLRSSRL